MEQATNEVSAYEQIDFVFDYIKGYLKHSAMISTEYIWNHVKEERTPEMGINNLMFQGIIKQLLDDELIKESPLPEGDAEDGQKMYSITFKGRLFKSYTEREAASQSDKIRISEVERQNSLRSIEMNRLTAVVALGTAGLFLLEVAKTTMRHYKVFPDVFSVSVMALFCVFLCGGILTTILYLLLKETRKK